MLKENLNKLIDIVTRDKLSDRVIEARKEYQSIVGNIYEDDKSYENRMALFLEWYIFDRLSPDTNQTTLETLMEKNQEHRSSNMLQLFKMFANNIHGLFVVKKIRDYSVKVLNLFDNAIYDANESFGKLIFSASGIFEGRLIHYNNMYYFTGNFCFHPAKVNKFIKKQVKQVGVITNQYKKEVKNRTTKLDFEKKSLHKFCSKIDKLKPKISKSYSDNKMTKIKNELAELETKRSDLDGKILNMESELKVFVYEKTILEPKTLQTQLIQKISHMQLVWERSRNIDLDDIYRN